MERLTSRNPLTESEVMNLSLTDLYMRLKAYEDAGEQGRLVVLPCNVGDSVFVIERDDKRPYEYCIKSSEPIKAFLVSVGNSRLDVEAISEYWYGGECGCLEKPEGIDEKYYFTREEAEKALEGMG